MVQLVYYVFGTVITVLLLKKMLAEKSYISPRWRMVCRDFLLQIWDIDNPVEVACAAEVECNTEAEAAKEATKEMMDSNEKKVNSKERVPVAAGKDRPIPYQPGDWVVVRYDDLLYPGEVISLPSNGIEINAMEPTTCGSFKWPTRKDVHTYLLEDVVKRIEPPIPCGSRASQFIFKDSF